MTETKRPAEPKPMPLTPTLELWNPKGEFEDPMSRWDKALESELERMDQADKTQRNILLSSHREAVLRLLQDGGWHPTSEINHPAIGGSEGTRRLRELRKLGYVIDKRKHEDHDDWEYRLVPVTEAVRRKRDNHD